MRLTPQDCCYAPALAILVLYLVAGHHDMKADAAEAQASIEIQRAAIVARGAEMPR